MKTIDFPEAIKLVSAAESMTRDERLKLQQERLKELVEYVRLHSPFLRELYKELPDNFKLADLPVTHKAQLNDNYDSWITDHELNKKIVLDYVDRDIDDTSLLLGKYTALKTSGSTGTPLPMVRDDYHNKIHNSMMFLRLMKEIDYNLFNPELHKTATVIHTSPGASSYCGFLRERAAHPDHTQNMLAVSVLESVESMVEKLNAHQPEVLTGYASSLLLLANEKIKGNLDIPVKVIGNSAELLTDEAYHKIKEAFGCSLFNNYCMTEGGEVAMANGSPDMLLNEDWVIVEPVDSEMKPMKDISEFSHGLLITDLSNYIQPVIRYYVNDRVRILPPKTKNGFPILKIDGRVLETFTLCGKHFTMAAILPKTEVWPGLLKFQAVQTGPDTLQLRGVCAVNYDAKDVLEGLSKQLEAYFHSAGCQNAVITYSLDPLLHNENGGKISPYINISK